MSSESSQWLNQNVLVGMTDKRGNAWHYRASDQGDEPNHYPQAIPVEDVVRRLFDWEALPMPVYFGTPDGKRHLIDKRQAIVASDNHNVLGIFTDGYQPHQYREWLLESVATILDDGLAISSAGLLKSRAVAWVEVSVPESVKTPEGVTFRPNLIACTSFDGSLATTYKRTVQLTVCDNTMAVALAEKGQQLKIRHSKGSALRITEAREALAIVYDTADDFAAEVARLTDSVVTEDKWQTLLRQLVPDGEGERTASTADQKRRRLDWLWNNDERVNPWHGTAFGALQAFNTWEHHERPVRGERAERNMLYAIDGHTDRQDAKVLAALGVN